MSDDSLYRRAEKRADEKIAFRKHLYGFIIANVFLALVNLFTSPGDWWFYWITVFWAIGLIIHFLKAYVLADSLEGNREEMIQKEMEKLKK